MSGFRGQKPAREQWCKCDKATKIISSFCISEPFRLERTLAHARVSALQINLEFALENRIKNLKPTIYNSLR